VTKAVTDSVDEITEDEREALVTIAAGAVVTSGGLSGRRALITAIEALLARGLGPVTYGVYALAWRVAQVLLRVVSFGSVPALQRFLPAYDGTLTRQSAVVGLAYATTVCFGVVFALVTFAASPWINAATVEQPAFVTTMRMFGLLVLLLGVLTVTGGVFRAVESARSEVILNKLLRPSARLVGSAAALALGLSVVGVAGAIVVCMGLLAVVAAPLAARMTGIRPSLKGARSEARSFFNHAAPAAMSRLGKVFQNRLDVLLVGTLLTAVSAGVYNVVLVLVTVGWIPLRSFNQLLPPVASTLYDEGRVDLLNTVYTSVTRLIVTCVVPIIAVLLVFGPELLRLFGATYERGYLPLVVYLGGVFVGSAVGATGWLLMMTDHQYARMALDWLLAALNVGLTYAFVVRFGLIGAAMGTSIAISVQNGIQVLLLRRFEGLWPFDYTFLTPVAAGGAAAATMAGARASATGPAAVGSGVSLGLVVYVGVLSVVGVDPRDRLVVRELTRRYRADLRRLASL
jgi:O-antigen/teichoic acid export membrane protein